jgi:excisionase family DNA binding protein
MKSATLSIEQTRRILGIGRNTAYEAARRGELPILRFGKVRRIPRAALEAMLRKGQVKRAMPRRDARRGSR